MAVVCAACTKDPENGGGNNSGGSGGGNGSGNAPTGAINGLFTINNSADQVYFSQGNLQYQASTSTWRFAEKQYYTIGENNMNVSSTYRGWIDLFGWGTSGWNCGNTYYRSWDSNTSNASSYGPIGKNNLTGSYAHSDWGVHNAISNGGNRTSLWRILTRSEWEFLLTTRYTSSGIRFAKAHVNGVNGVILVPDDWNVTTFSLNNTNESDASFSSNVVGEMVWQNTFEPAGAVFLPAAGYRYGTSVNGVGSYGHYWSASYYNSYGAYYVDFDYGYLYTDSAYYRYYGFSVRLVCSSQ